MTMAESPRISRRWRSVLALSALSALVAVAGCSVEDAEVDDELADPTDEPIATEAQAQRTILPNCRDQNGKAWRLRKHSDGICTYVTPVYDPREWISSGPSPLCTTLWRRLGCFPPPT